MIDYYLNITLVPTYVCYYFINIDKNEPIVSKFKM